MSKRRTKRKNNRYVKISQKKQLFNALTISYVILFSHSVFAEEEENEASESVSEETTAEEVMPEETEVNDSEMNYPNPAKGEKGFEVISNTDETGEVFDPRITYPELEGKKQF